MNTQVFIEGFSAFAGAFFAFVFLRLSEFFSKIYDRQVKHFNSLVLLEGQLNELGGIINDNIFVIPGFISAITSGNLFFSKLRELPIDRSHYTTLHDVHLINELFSFNYQLRKLNDDMDSLSSGYSDIKNAFIQKQINRDDFILNAEISAHHLRNLKIFLLHTEETRVMLMARVRLMLQKDVPLGTKLIRPFIRTSGERLSAILIQEEFKKINDELNQTRERSKAEIKEVINKFSSK